MNRKKKKPQINYLDLIPERAAGLDWSQDEKGIVNLKIENTGLFNRIAQKLFRRPRFTTVHMEKYGSCLWLFMDGERTVMELAKLQKERFGEEVEPLYPRVVKYMQIMESYRFISFKNKPVK